MSNQFDYLLARLNLYYVQGHAIATEKEIADWESTLGYTLPDDYREFLLNLGFSASKGTLICPIPGREPDDGPSIEVFFGLKRTHSYDLRSKRKLLLERPFDRILPCDKLAIASSPGGVICISLSGTDRESVYCWGANADTDDFTDGTSFLAPDFTTFVNALRLIPWGETNGGDRGNS